MAEQRLIDANDVVTIQVFDEMTEEYFMQTMPIAEMIDRWTDEGCPPTIDAVPVVHARWEPIDGTGDGIYKLWRCSACKNGTTAGGETGPDVPYCFCCGAKMDGRL